MSATNLEASQTPPHSPRTISSPALSSVSSASDIANSHFSWDMDGTSITAGGDAIPTASHEVQEHILTPHTKHFYANGMIDIRVENVLFRVPRLGLASYSESFAALMDAHNESMRAQCSDSAEPLYIKEENVTGVGFGRLLDLIYPSTYGKVSLETQDEWLSVLHLATKWSFDDLRTLSIERLGSLPTTSAIDKLLMGRTYNVSHWVSEAYVVLCQRSESLTLGECQRLLLEDVVKINDTRHKARVYTGMRPLAEIRSVIEEALKPPQPPISDSVAAETSAPSQATSTSPHPDTAAEVNGALDSALVFGPMDIPRIARLIKAYASKPSEVTAAALDVLTRPYCNQAPAMNSLSELVAKQLRDNPDDKNASCNLTCFAQTLLEMVTPSCRDLGEEIEQPPLRGSQWLAERFVKHCTVNVDNWKSLSTFNQKSTVVFLGWLNKTGHLSYDIFQSCWVEMVCQTQEHPSSWAHTYSVYNLLDSAGRGFQTPANALLIDEFFGRVLTLYGENSSKHTYNYNNGCCIESCISCRLSDLIGIRM